MLLTKALARRLSFSSERLSEFRRLVSWLVSQSAGHCQPYVNPRITLVLGLASIHPIYHKRCERDGLDFETMGLGEEDLELDDGTPVPIEQPTEIKTPPLSEKEQDDRVRMAFGLTHDDPLPDVSPETLMTYYRYLAANLKFPFFISYWAKSGPFSSKKVIVPISRLDPPVEDEFDEEAGLYGIGVDQDEEIEIPLAEIELKKKEANYRLISDYSYWFHNWW